ncbi:MAG: ABC transporter substrate-binding protein [Micrococcales bacterium 73-15]|uniref:ABC transporter substrate-binding protein n=1 Tax=Salana multivorans TaxID=120377 RepID=UPI0009647676|nr:ABC transporter substrate-binding protein [Salana multivorans]OJX96886.1 MAG: ABC transporter substrate-binding protein [Micrococcales bacterium 73-15]
MRSLTRTALTATTLAVALALAACGGSPTGGGTSTDGGDPTGSAPAGGDAPQEVTFWGSWSGAQAEQLDKQAAAFNAAQDRYVVTYVPQELVEEKLLTAVAGGSVPDIVLWDRYQTSLYAQTNALAPIDDFIESSDVDLDQFYEQALSEMIVDGETYGLPLLVDNRSLFYATDALAEAGLEPPTTWDELRSVAEALTIRSGNRLERSGFALNDPGLFNVWLTQAGGSMYTEDGSATAFNGPEGLEVLDFWSSLLDAGVYEVGFGEGVDAFAEGIVTMKYDGPWALADLDAADVEYGIVPPPTGPGGQGAGMGGFGLVIPNGAKNAEGAWEFMKWWTTQPENGVEFAKISGWIPANIEAANDPYFTENESYAAFIETMSFAKVRSRTPGASDVEGKALIPALERFLSGEIDAETALADAQRLGDQILADNR